MVAGQHDLAMACHLYTTIYNTVAYTTRGAAKLQGNWGSLDIHDRRTRGGIPADSWICLPADKRNQDQGQPCSDREE